MDPLRVGKAVKRRSQNRTRTTLFSGDALLSYRYWVLQHFQRAARFPKVYVYHCGAELRPRDQLMLSTLNDGEYDVGDSAHRLKDDEVRLNPTSCCSLF